MKISLEPASAGQQRRVALTRLWLTDAQLWILDEPFTALDATAMETLTCRLEQHARQGGSAILTTHRAAAAAALSVAHPAPRRRRGRRAMMRALLFRELRLAWRSGAEILNPLWFFLIVITLLSVRRRRRAAALLAQIAPGVVWVAARRRRCW